MVDFTLRDCELDFGDYVLGTDIAIDLESDGHDFAVTHLWLNGNRQSGTIVKLIEEWVSADLARSKVRGGKSLVHAAYEAELIERDDNRANDRAEWSRQFLHAA
jgi:hypothetical protein